MPHEVITDKTLTTQDHLFKLIIIGDTGVGKSCLMKRVMDNEFKVEHQVTIGVEFGSFGLKVDNGKIIKLQIWDTAGQERFSTITTSYYKGADVAVIVYAQDNKDSFLALQDWVYQIKKFCKDDVLIVLV